MRTVTRSALDILNDDREPWFGDDTAHADAPSPIYDQMYAMWRVVEVEDLDPYRSPAREYDEAARFATGLRNAALAMLILVGIVLAVVWVVA